MSGQIISREEVLQSAEQAFLSGKSIEDVSVEMIPYQNDWAEAFRLAEFEATSEDEPCSI